MVLGRVLGGLGQGGHICHAACQVAGGILTYGTSDAAQIAHRDRLYRLHEWLEVDDAQVGGKRSGKRSRGAEGKSPVQVACEERGEHAWFLAMEVVPSVTA